MDWIFAIFFLIIVVLRGITWLVEQLKGSEQAPPLSGQGKAPPPQKKESPLQSVMRMLEEASNEEQRREEERRQRARPRPKQRVRRAEPPVLRAKPVPQPKGERLSQHHLDSEVADRHLQSAVGDRHTGTRRGADRLTGLDRRRDSVKGIDLWAILQTRTPLQRAVILKEVLGPPRSAKVMQRGRAQTF